MPPKLSVKVDVAWLENVPSELRLTTPVPLADISKSAFTPPYEPFGTRFEPW